jgi:Asp-tRNA(Asn)/Glu-tRNA(Gln) amidotransferase A subunit family amidase
MANRINDLTPKQLHFCRAVVSGCTMSDAYREAYSTSRMKPAAIHVEASRFMAHPKISLRVEQLNKAKDRALIGAAVSDRDRVLNKLRELMDSAKGENVQLGAAVALGKTQALFTDTIQEKRDTRTPEEITAELEVKLAAFVSGMLKFTAPINFAGVPAMSVPLNWSPTLDLPIGSYFIARRGGDKTLYELAYELEAAVPWRDIWPPFSLKYIPI